MTAPNWLELLVRMTAGEESEQPFVGVLEVTEMRHSDDGTPRVATDEEREWPSPVRVFKDRQRYRVETLDGDVLTIRNDEHTFVFGGHVHGAEDEVDPRTPHRFAHERDSGVRHGAHGHDIERRAVTDWRGDDFTTPAGPARQTTFLGRAAWDVELAPPPHKPSPLVLTVDAVNGMVYQQRSVHFGVLSRWTEIVDVASHPDSLFEWDGDAYWYEGSFREVSDEDVREWEQQRAEEAARLGLGGLVLSTPVEVGVHEHEDDGSFFVSLDVGAHGALLRRPTSSEPWHPDINYPFVEQWSDDQWDWCAASDSSADAVTQIRRQLDVPRPEER